MQRAAGQVQLTAESFNLGAKDCDRLAVSRHIEPCSQCKFVYSVMVPVASLVWHLVQIHVEGEYCCPQSSRPTIALQESCSQTFEVNAPAGCLHITAVTTATSAGSLLMVLLHLCLQLPGRQHVEGKPASHMGRHHEACGAVSGGNSGRLSAVHDPRAQRTFTCST